MNPSLQICLIGAGNLAWHIGPALSASGARVVQVFSRTEGHARELAQRCNCSFTLNLPHLTTDADIYLLCLTDDAVEEVLADIPLPSGAILVHTAGSLPLQLLTRVASRAGVFYPLQTFTRGVPVDLSATPFLIEGTEPDVFVILTRIALGISRIVHPVNSEQRLALHLAAMFSSNFVNHLWALTEKRLDPQQLGMELLYPLISETLRKARETSPASAQTGPARRGDEKTMLRHLRLLEEKSTEAAIYKLLSASIRDFYTR